MIEETIPAPSGYPTALATPCVENQVPAQPVPLKLKAKLRKFRRPGRKRGNPVVVIPDFPSSISESGWSHIEFERRNLGGAPIQVSLSPLHRPGSTIRWSIPSVRNHSTPWKIPRSRRRIL